MRKIVCIIKIMPVFLLLLLAGCGESSKEAAELALITDVGTIEDGSFNQGAWEGIKRYAEESGVNYRYYQPKEASTTAYLETIKEAVKNGVKLIVCPGYLPEEAVYQATIMLCQFYLKRIKPAFLPAMLPSGTAIRIWALSAPLRRNR